MSYFTLTKSGALCKQILPPSKKFRLISCGRRGLVHPEQANGSVPDVLVGDFKVSECLDLAFTRGGPEWPAGPFTVAGRHACGP